MKNQKWNKILLADEIAGIAYYLVYMSEIKQLLAQFGTWITTISLMLAALMIGRLINLIMNRMINFYFRISKYYQKQQLGPINSVELMVIKQRLNDKSTYSILQVVENFSIDHIDDTLIFYRELYRSIMVICCFHVIDVIGAFTSYFDIVKIILYFIFALIGSIAFSQYDLKIKRASITYYLQEQVQGDDYYEI